MHSMHSSSSSFTLFLSLGFACLSWLHLRMQFSLKTFWRVCFPKREILIWGYCGYFEVLRWAIFGESFDQWPFTCAIHHLARPYVYCLPLDTIHLLFVGLCHIVIPGILSLSYSFSVGPSVMEKYHPLCHSAWAEHERRSRESNWFCISKGWMFLV